MTPSVVAGEGCCLAQNTTDAMVRAFLSGGLPSSLTPPFTEPAVAGSTGLPAGLATAVAPSDESCPLPQPTTATAKTAKAAMNRNDLPLTIMSACWSQSHH